MNYYNEHDPKAAAWLRVLIEENQIAKGEVDERDIQDVRAADLSGFRQCHFFAGIGGWSLALRLAGIPDDFPVWTGSCPCQPFSVAGKGMGESDERHLWPDFRNLIGRRRPAIVFGEQVASKDGCEWLAGVSADLEAARYRFAAADLCAGGVGSPQKRQRFFWVADTENFNRRSEQQPGESATDRRRGFAGDSTTDAVAVSNGEQDHPADAGRLHAESGGCGRLVQPDGAGRDAWRIASAGDGHRSAVESADARDSERKEGVALGDTDRPGLERHRRHERQHDAQGWQGTQRHGSASGFWDNFRIVQTSDGKIRRIPVEPAFFPLVNGFPGRVAVLKGFGNAIVPQVAARFIECYFESLTPPLTSAK